MDTKALCAVRRLRVWQPNMQKRAPEGSQIYSWVRRASLDGHPDSRKPCEEEYWKIASRLQ